MRTPEVKTRRNAGGPCEGRISPRGATVAPIALAALVAVGVAGCATAPAQAPTGPRTVTRQELTVEAPAGWSDISGEGKPGLGFFRKTGEKMGTSVSIWPFNIPPGIRHRSPAEHTRGYFAAEREQSRPLRVGRWEGWQEEVREIDGRPYPIMRFRIVFPPPLKGDVTSSGLLLLYFPDDFAARQRFYVILWQAIRPASEVATGLEALDAFVRSIRLASATAAEKVAAAHAEQTGDQREVAAPPDARLIDRAARFITGGYEKILGARLTGVQLLPFKSKVPGTMQWKAVVPERDGKPSQFFFPVKILAEFQPEAPYNVVPPGWVLMITVSGPTDNEVLALTVLSALQTTSDPQCFWREYRALMKAFGKEREAFATERQLRAAAAAGSPQAVVMAVGGRTWFWDNNGELRPCFKFEIAGDWKPSGEPGLLVTPDRRSAVGVEFLSPQLLSGMGY